jgi:hypothetical protein
MSGRQSPSRCLAALRKLIEENTVDYERVKHIATAVRRAFESCDPAELPWPFPRAACGDTAMILGQVLYEQGIEGFMYVWGEKHEANGEYSSHGWLQNGEWIVDITADQFADVHDPVIVTNSSPWHEAWEQCPPSESTLAPSDARLWQITAIMEPLLVL